MIDLNPSLQPNETGNANNIKVVSTAILPLALLRHEAVADFYTQEPMFIHVQAQEEDDFDIFEQIFRLRFWISNESSYSWCIYSNSREWQKNLEPGFVIRHAFWKRRSDMKKCMEYRKNQNIPMSDRINNPEDPLYHWPNMELRNTYLKPDASLIEVLLDIDNILLNGVNLQERDSLKKMEWEDIDWDNMDVMRLFQWGTIHLVFGFEMQNQQLESALYKLQAKLTGSVEIESDSVHQMVLDYSLPPRLFKLSREYDLSEALIEVS